MLNAGWISQPEYWPFGNEGGFCNPMKLQVMAEDRSS